MPDMREHPGHQRTVRHYREPGDVHELTFSCCFWQKGPGYDRNLQSAEAVMASIDYLHNNPVVRGLCREAVEWKWSSARWYASDGRDVDPDLPTIDGLPAEFWDE